MLTRKTPSRNIPTRPAAYGTNAPSREIKCIVVERHSQALLGKPMQFEYLVKWKGLSDAEDSWEPADTLLTFTKQIEDLLDEKLMKALT